MITNGTRLFIADYGSHNVYEYDLFGNLVLTISTYISGGSYPGTAYPFKLAIDNNGWIIVASWVSVSNERIDAFDATTGAIKRYIANPTFFTYVSQSYLFATSLFTAYQSSNEYVYLTVYNGNTYVYIDSAVSPTSYTTYMGGYFPIPGYTGSSGNNGGVNGLTNVLGATNNLKLIGATDDGQLVEYTLPSTNIHIYSSTYTVLSYITPYKSSSGSPYRDSVSSISYDYATGDFWLTETGFSTVTRFAGYTSNSYQTVNSYPITNSITNQDGNYAELDQYAPSDYIYHYNYTATFVMYDIINEHISGVNLNFNLTQDSQSQIFNNEHLSIPISSNATYGSGEIVITLSISNNNGSTLVYISMFDTGINQYVQSSTIRYSQTFGGGSTTDIYRSPSVATWFKTLNVFIDEIVVTSVQSTSFYKMTTTYQGNDFFQSSLSFYNFNAYASYILYLPEEMNFSYVLPAGTVVESGNNYILSDTVIGTYTIYFLSGSGYGRDYTHQSNIVAIQDNTSDLLKCPGFETCYSNDFSNYNFDTSSLNNTIVQSGISSLKVTKSASGSTADLSLNALDSGYYYISFDYYIESDTGSSFSYKYYQNTWSSTSLDTSVTDRWVHVAFYCNIISSTTINAVTTNFAFELSSSVSNFNAFIDNFNIYTVSTIAKTIQTNQLQITSKLNFGTPYGLYPASNQNVSLSLWDRTAQSQLWQTYLTTDGNGQISYTFQGSLDQREYEIRVWALNNYFYDSEYYAFNDLATYQGFNGAQNGNEFYNASDYTSAWNIIASPYADTGSSFDISNFDYVIFDLKSNITLTFNQIRILGFWTGSTYPEMRLTNNFYSTSVWNTFIFTKNSMTNLNSFLENNVERVLLNVVTTGNYSIYIRNLHFIQSQKYYFTPSPVSNVLGKEWGFSQGDAGSFTYLYHATQTIINGYADYIGSTFSNGFIGSGSTNTLIIDSSYYNKLNTRFYTNTSNVQINLDFRCNSVYVSNKIGNFSVGWNIISEDISSNNYWKGTCTQVYFLLYYSKSSTINIDFKLDYYRVIHQDSNITNGIDFIFNQNDYFNNWAENNVLSTDTVTNGYFKTLALTSSTRFSIENINSFMNTFNLSDYSYFDVILKASISNFYISNLYFLKGSTYTGITGHSYSVKTYFTEIKIPLSIKSSWTGGGWNGISFYISGSVTNGVSLTIKSISLVKSDSSSVVQKGSNYVTLNTEQNYNYNIWLDSVNIGQYSSNQQIYLNTSYGTHTLRYQAYSLVSSTGIFISSVIYEYTYIIYQTYDANINTFVLSSDFVSIYYSINKNSNVYIYENNSLITSKTNTLQDSLKWSRDTSAKYVSVGIKFLNAGNSSEFKWFNTSYSNDLVITITNLAFYTNSTDVIITWSSITSSVSAVVSEDGSSKGTFTSSTIVYAKSSAVGLHYVAVQFTRANYISSAFTFSYTVDQFVITFSQFYTNLTSVLYQFNSDQSGVIASLYQDGSLQSSGSANTVISFTKSPIVGQHYVTIVFGKTNQNNLTYSFSYDVNSFAITSLQFYTNSSNVLVQFSSSTTGVTAYLYENAILKATGPQNALISYSKNIIPGTYFVSAIFVKADNNNISTVFSYTVTNFAITNSQFFTNSTDVIFNYLSSYSNITSYAFENNIYKSNSSTNQLIYPKETAIGTYYVSIILVKQNNTNITLTYSYTVNQFSITSLYFYTTNSTYTISYQSSLSTVNISVIDDGINRVSNSNNNSLILTKDSSQGTHFVTLIFSAPGQSNLTFIETYNTKPLVFTTPFQYYVNYGTSITLFYALSQKANITITFDNKQLLTLNNTKSGNYTLSASLENGSTMFAQGIHQITFIASTDGLDPLVQYITWQVNPNYAPGAVTISNNFNLTGWLIFFGILLTIVAVVVLRKPTNKLKDEVASKFLEIILDPEDSGREFVNKALALRNYMLTILRRKQP